MARIGIFGGSFHPPHLGHILAAREFQKKLALDTLLLIPAGDPPHKTIGKIPAAHRLEMTRLAAQDLEDAQVLDLELRREGRSYTADTVEALREQYPDDELFLLMGTDMFYTFGKWYQPERIVREVTLAVAHRDSDKREDLLRHAAELENTLGARVVFVENQFLPYSSTSVRAMLAFGCGAHYLAPQVLDYIRNNGLYLQGESLKNLPFARLEEVSLSLHKTKRVAHVRGCSETAAALAEHYGADVTDARRAGILHDITKALTAEEQLQLAEDYQMPLSDFERGHPKLLHAKTGAVIAREIFGENAAVCDAITWHTTAKADLSLLGKIIYLADYMEPNRTLDGVEELRRLTWTDLDAALQRGLEMSLAHVLSTGAAVDPNSHAALCALKERKQIYE